MHDNVIVTAPGLADGANIHALVCARYENDFESLGFYEMPQTGRTEGSDRLDHFRGQFHLLVDLLFAHRRIFYNGISLNDLDMPQIRRQKVSYVEQHPTMFNISVQNYLHFGVDDSELVGYNQSILLKMFELEYLLDKEINENGSNLSGGEKQKLSIVRSLSKDSSLILLDEPTSALDQKSITTLIEYLELRKQQAIIVIVSHDSRILSSCDELVEMR